MPNERTIEYRPRDHWNTSNSKMRAYDVFVDGVLVGHIERVLKSTDRQYNTIRVPGKGRLAWSWQRTDGTSNYPGLYARTRKSAVAQLLGER